MRTGTLGLVVLGGLVVATAAFIAGHFLGEAVAAPSAAAWQHSELRANTYTHSKQYGASLAVSPGGAVLVSWQSKRQQDSTHGAYAQRFQPDGTRVGEEIQLNLTTTSQQWKPSVASVGDEFFAAWESRFQDGSGTGCYLRRLDSDAEMRVHETTQGDQADVCLASGNRGMVAVFLDCGRPYARLFGADGRPAVAPVALADVQADQISVDSAADGSFVVAWSAVRRGIQARCFTANGQAKGPVLRVNRDRDSDAVSIEPSLAVAGDGGFVVAWLSRAKASDRDGYDVRARRFARDGQPLGEEIVVSPFVGDWQSGAHTAIDTEGRVCVAWNLERTGAAATSIRARVLTAEGLSQPFAMTSHTRGNQRLLTASGRRCLAFGPAGRLFVAWSGDGGQGDESGAYLTVLTPNRPLPAGLRPELAQPHDPPILVPHEESAGVAFAKGPDFGFQGTSRVQWSPSDPHIAAGPDHVVMVTNDEIAFYEKGGKRTFKTLIWGTKGFWGTAGSSGKLFDPEVHWDPHADRFVAFANERVGFGTSLFVIAISDDKNPNGTWYKFRFDVTKMANTGQGGGGIDSPNLGIDSQAYYMTGDIPFQGTKRHLVFIVEKKPMLLGKAPKITSNFLISGKTKFGLPVVHGKVPGDVMFLMEELTGTIGGSAKAIRLYAIQSPLNKPKIVSTNLTVPTYTRSGSVVAKGTSVKIATFDSRFWSCMWRNGSLWACHHIGSSVVKARWYEIKTNLWPVKGLPTLVQSGDVDMGKGVNTAYNAITADADGNAMMVFAMASANDYMSIGRAWRAAGDKKGTMRPPQIVQSSTVVNRVFRWGDYGGISLDPKEPNTVWYAHQLAASNWNWTTWIGKKVMAPLAADNSTLSMQSGGSVEFTLDNPSHKNKPYLMLATASGTRPGFALGSARVPINVDLATQVGLAYLNTPPLQGFLGVLDKDGLAKAKLTVPPFAGLLGLQLHFAYVQDGTAWDFASNAVPLRVVK